MCYVVRSLEWPQYTELEEWRKGRVSRETDATFHVKQVRRALGLGHAPAPARRFDHQVVQVTGRDAGNARRLRQRRRADAIQLLARLRRQTLELEVGKLQRQRERGELRQSPGRLALTREIAVVLELDLRARDGVGVGGERHARCFEQRVHRCAA